MIGRTRDLLMDGTQHAVRSASTSVIQGVRRTGRSPATVRDLRDALTIAYPDAVFTGWTAAALHGAEYTDGHPPEIWLPDQRTRKGVVIRAGKLADEDVTVVLRRRATTGPRTAVDIARRTVGDDAIVGVDQCLRVNERGHSVTTADEILRYLESHPGMHGCRRVRAVLAETAVGADSPWETYTRLTVHRAGLTMFAPQVTLPGLGYRLDLGAPQYRVAIEYDGAYHRSVQQQRRDVARWNAITGAGWAIIRATSTTLTRDRAVFLARVESELRRRGWTGPPLDLAASAAVSVRRFQVSAAETAENAAG